MLRYPVFHTTVFHTTVAFLVNLFLIDQILWEPLLILIVTVGLLQHWAGHLKMGKYWDD